MFDIDFYSEALDPKTAWEANVSDRLASRSIPAGLIGRRRTSIVSDAYREWARWFAYSLLSAREAERLGSYPRIFDRILSQVRLSIRDLTQPEEIRLSRIISTFMHEEVKALAASRQRTRLSRRDKYYLLDISGSPPRCWITGRVFSEEAIDRFLGDESKVQSLPLFIDSYVAVGGRTRDLTIEIDHTIPYSLGGGDGDNLRLVSGWVNSNKSNYMSLYEASSRPLRLRTSTGVVTAPRPIWSIRTLALQRRCEHYGGCSATSTTEEMRITKINLTGDPVPSNLKVVCAKHDDTYQERLVPRDTYK